MNAFDQQINLPLAEPKNEQLTGKLNPTASNQSSQLMQRILDRTNLVRALNQVQRNKGAPGVDGVTVEELPTYLKQHWVSIREQLLSGTYKPFPVKRVEIPKPDGSKRKLGIPTVIDRLIQQAIAQVLGVQWESQFHQNSFGFRPNKSAHQAVKQMQTYVCEGYQTVVDIDLKSFFDEVNHDRLMFKLKERGTPVDVLKLINHFLKTSVENRGKLERTTKGVPQGGPLSPLLANIVLNELDWELEKRKLNFVRYADDCQIFVRSRRSGERRMKSLTNFIEKTLRLKVNKDKSSVSKPWHVSFLGFTLDRRSKRIKVSAKALEKLKVKIKMLTSSNSRPCVLNHNPRS